MEELAQDGCLRRRTFFRLETRRKRWEAQRRLRGRTSSSPHLPLFLSFHQLHSNRFTYDGNRLKDEDTPDSLGMEENDSIGEALFLVSLSRSTLSLLADPRCMFRVGWDQTPISNVSGTTPSFSSESHRVERATRTRADLERLRFRWNWTWD